MRAGLIVRRRWIYGCSNGTYNRHADCILSAFPPRAYRRCVDIVSRVGHGPALLEGEGSRRANAVRQNQFVDEENIVSYGWFHRADVEAKGKRFRSYRTRRGIVGGGKFPPHDSESTCLMQSVQRGCVGAPITHTCNAVRPTVRLCLQ